MSVLTARQISLHLKTVPEWTKRGQIICRTCKFAGFLASIAFVHRVAKRAQKMNHHPDIDIRFDKVTLTLTTHDEGGIMVASTRFSWCPCQLGRPSCESQGHPFATRGIVFGRLLSDGVSIATGRAIGSKRRFTAEQLLQPAPSTAERTKRCQPVAIH